MACFSDESDEESDDDEVVDLAEAESNEAETDEPADEPELDLALLDDSDGDEDVIELGLL